MTSDASRRWIAIGFASVMIAAAFSGIDRAAIAAPGVSQPAGDIAGETLSKPGLQLINHKTGRYECDSKRTWFCRGLTPCTGLRCRAKLAGGARGPEKYFHQNCGPGLRGGVTYWTPLERRQGIRC